MQDEKKYIDTPPEMLILLTVIIFCIVLGAAVVIKRAYDNRIELKIIAQERKEENVYNRWPETQIYVEKDMIIVEYVSSSSSYNYTFDGIDYNKDGSATIYMKEKKESGILKSDPAFWTFTVALDQTVNIINFEIR